MRYVAMVVVFGLLVVGAGVYSAQSAQGAATHDRRLIEWPGRENSINYSIPVWKTRMDQARINYVTLKETERKQQEQARKNLVATEQFGEWGPYLVEAAEAYGQDPAALYRVMICESGGDPNADNGVCKGLFQFNPGTWAGTPFGDQSIYDGHAQIQAAAWMWSQGRKGEWTCG
ncbi:MAG: transglycosylase SLT domain-containing protein [Thermoleophilia bacterium]